MAIGVLGNGLTEAKHHEDALVVEEAQVSMMRRIGVSERQILTVQGNLASSYFEVGRAEEALVLRRDVYSGVLKMSGEESTETLMEANRYAACLGNLQRFDEARSLLRKTAPVARRVLGEGHQFTLLIRRNYSALLYTAAGATLADLRLAVNTLEEVERTARRVFGSAHPDVAQIERHLGYARSALRARETPGDA